MLVKERVSKLKELMKENHIDAYIVPSSDAHQSEYVAPHWATRKWITGFTGSAGTAIITLDKGDGLWTDGRYFIQAEKQLEGSGIKLFRMAQANVPTVFEWLSENLGENSTIGFDGKVISKSFFDNLNKALDGKNINYKLDKDLIDQIWSDRDSIPEEALFTLNTKFAGKSRTEKIQDVRDFMSKHNYTHFILSSLDDIAWLLNIRGNDVPCNPVVISYVVVSHDETILFVDKQKVTKKAEKELVKDNITIKNYSDLQSYIEGLDKKSYVTYDANKTNMWIVNSINKAIKVKEEPNITTIQKAVKNSVEIENMKNSHIRDGVAMVKFLYWLKKNIGKEKITEITASDKLEQLRSMGENYKGLSFGTIAGYKEHAAMMHYSATEETAYELSDKHMFLVDSGAQYLDGTTDITRTIVLGDITDEEKRDFTLVLKSMIDLADAKFLYGSNGMNLDIIAREPLWKYGIDYKCGTGHGIGFFLNVHEGPHGLRQSNVPTVFESGMVVTDEPGVYKEGKHGIRTENVLIVVDDEETESGKFMKFDTLTLCPIDLAGVDVNLLTLEERAWLNNYHKTVYDTLSQYLDENERQFLRYETRAI